MANQKYLFYVRTIRMTVGGGDIVLASDTQQVLFLLPLS
jgi:hypothetical protein